MNLAVLGPGAVAEAIGQGGLETLKNAEVLRETRVHHVDSGAHESVAAAVAELRQPDVVLSQLGALWQVGLGHQDRDGRTAGRAA